MHTLTLHEAAEFLKLHPETVRLKTIAGDIPGVKPGKRWVFLKERLVDWLENQYTKKSDAMQGEKKCNFTKEKTVLFGGIDSPHRTEKEYDNLLKLPTKQKPRK